MQPRIEKIASTTLIGNRTKMSFANNKTLALWQRFMPNRKKIHAVAGTALYSVELYSADFFLNFSPTKEFEKWAAVEVNEVVNIPDGMETLLIPMGEYAVFPYKGKPSEAQKTYQYIYSEWIPSSEYVLDDRPHFSLMGEKYLGEHPESEEEFWIPIRRK